MTRIGLEIVPIFTGIIPLAEKSIQQLLTGIGQKIDVYTYMWVIRGGDHPIVVDTGTGTPELVHRYHGRILKQDRHPREALLAAGINPDDVRTVIQTHLHWDHALGFELDLFPNASHYIQEAEIRYAVAPLGPQTVMYTPTVLRKLSPAFASDYRNVKLVRGDWQVAPGVKALLTPGHSPGLMAVLVDTAKGTYAIASDNVAFSEQIKGPTFYDWIPSGLHLDLSDAMDSLARLVRVADEILPSHDGCVLEHEVYP